MVHSLRRPRHRSGHSHPEPPFLLLPSLTEREEFSMKIPGVRDHQGHLHPPILPSQESQQLQLFGQSAYPQGSPQSTGPRAQPATEPLPKKLSLLQAATDNADDSSQKKTDWKEAPYQHSDLAQQPGKAQEETLMDHS